MNTKHCVLALSGGLDSTSLMLHMLAQGYAVHGVSFKYGQKHEIELTCLQKNLELLQAKSLAITHRVIDLSAAMGLFYSALINPQWDVPEGHYEHDNMKATVVPNRNAIFASIIYGYALSIANQKDCQVPIGLGVHAGDHAVYPDCRPEFYNALEKAFQIGNYDSEKVCYALPYLNLDKKAILQDAKSSCEQLQLDFNTIYKNTHTCYAPNQRDQSCGRCGSCTERLEAFESLSLRDPIAYQ